MLNRILALCALAFPAAAAVPGQVDFQGLLLDSSGQKVNGAVDLVFTLFGAPTGGSALWTESHPDVPVSDGVYGVTLGTTTPLTPAILGSGNVHLQISVDGETLTPRRQLLAVPYAVRAQTAENSENVAGVAGGFYGQIIEDFQFDGGTPPNLDPSEGFGDADGDGLANFMDSDNDADSFSDVAELAQGSDINLVTPVITAFSPDVRLDQLPATVHVTGSNFEPGMSVSVGGANVAPTNVTAGAFDVVFPTQTATQVNVVVTRLNGQSAQKLYTFRGRRVFATLAVWGGNFGGAAAADVVCQNNAASQSLNGTFRAWVSDSTTSPAARFTQGSGGFFQRLDGTKIADDWADLTDGTLDAAIVPGANPPAAWTGTAADGTPLGGTCSNWTSNSAAQNGRRGIPQQTDSQWSATGADLACNNSLALYCFEQ
jgi:hypothetical protein